MRRRREERPDADAVALESSVSQAESLDEPKLASSSLASYSLEMANLALELVPRDVSAVLKDCSAAEEGDETCVGVCSSAAMNDSASSAVSHSCSIVSSAAVYESLGGVGVGDGTLC